MASKYIKKWLTFHVIRELQIETMRYCHTPIRMTKSKTVTQPNAGEDVRSNRNSQRLIAGRNAQWCRHFGGQFDSFLQI